MTFLESMQDLVRGCKFEEDWKAAFLYVVTECEMLRSCGVAMDEAISKNCTSAQYYLIYRDALFWKASAEDEAEFSAQYEELRKIVGLPEGFEEEY